MPTNINNHIPVPLGALGISVGVKLPKSVTDALKLAPSLAKELPKYTQQAERQIVKAEAAIDSVNLTIQTLGVAVVFGGIIIALLMREKEGKKA